MKIATKIIKSHQRKVMVLWGPKAEA